MNLNPNTKAAYKLLHNGVLAFARAEQQGIRIDMQYAEQKKQHLGVSACNETNGINGL